MKHRAVIIAFCAVWMLGVTAGAAWAGSYKAALITTAGSKVDDGTFNQAAYQGMTRAAKDFGFESSFIETQQPTDYEKNIEELIREGYGVILTVGFMLGDATKAMAEKHPDTKFIIVDFAYDPAIPNVMGLVFAEDQSGYLAGALAGLMTKNKIVGIVMGKEIPPVVRYRTGYEAGVRKVCPDCEVLAVYLDSFVDPARGKAAALSQIDEGADVIFGAGGITGSGACLGAAQAGTYVVGVDIDEYETTFQSGQAAGSDRLLTSALKRMDVAVYEAFRAVSEGTYEGGTQLFDAARDGVGLAPFHDAEKHVPDQVRETLDAIMADLKSGKITTGANP